MVTMYYDRFLFVTGHGQYYENDLTDLNVEAPDWFRKGKRDARLYIVVSMCIIL